jgi:hypothetical protein
MFHLNNEIKTLLLRQGCRLYVVEVVGDGKGTLLILVPNFIRI